MEERSITKPNTKLSNARLKISGQKVMLMSILELDWVIKITM